MLLSASSITHMLLGMTLRALWFTPHCSIVKRSINGPDFVIIRNTLRKLLYTKIVRFQGLYRGRFCHPGAQLMNVPVHEMSLFAW